MAYIPKPEKNNYGRAHQNRKRSHDFYRSPVWRKVRKLHLQRYPFCVECESRGKLISAKVVDHIRRVNPANPYDTQNGTWGEPLSSDNLQGLCSSCHNKKSAKERHQK
jgi:5-methylcytosine-specific restriction protein A